jgi:hypothetical protein
MTLPLVLASVLAAPRGAVAGHTGVLTGRVLPSGDERVTATLVWVGAVPAAVAPDGSFRVDEIPGGPAEVAIETSEGLYVVATPITIAPGTTRRVQLAFGGRQDTSAPPPPEKKKKRGGVWANPLSASLIIVGSAIVLGLAVDQLTPQPEDVPVSPSTN